MYRKSEGNGDPPFLTESEHRRLIIASGGVCEVCGLEFGTGRMRVIQLEGEFRDRQAGLLILCEGCSLELQKVHVPAVLLRRLVAERPFAMRQLFRKILGQRSDGIPVTGQDMEVLYNIACSSWSLNGSG